MKYEYLPADIFFAVNERTKVLDPAYFSLPEPPPIELIEGYGLPPEEQYFRRDKIPERLEIFIKNIRAELDAKAKGDKSGRTVVTGQKINDALKERFEAESNNYKEEIKWIKNCWWYRVYGKWFFNYGKPTYITGVHWFAMNHGYMVDTHSTSNYPEYRETDRKRYLLHEYVETTTETFAKLDKKGFAIAEEDGSYEMIDVGMRTLVGVIQPKNRRDGATYCGLTRILEKTTRTKGAKSGIQSYNADNASEHFRKKLVPMWQELPFYFKPVWDGTNSPAGEISFSIPSTRPMGEALRSSIDYAQTGESTYYNGGPLFWDLMDEEGQPSESLLNVKKRWGTNKKCHVQGIHIRGFSFHPSTVNEMKLGGQAFYELFNTSNFYQRNAKGQTMSGLVSNFKPGYECQEGCVGRYGESIEEKPTELQRKNGYRLPVGSRLMLEDEIELAKKEGESIEDIIAGCPRDLDDVFRYVGGDIGMDTEILNSRITQIKIMDKEPIFMYSLDWENGFGSNVIPRYDPANGRWQVKNLPPERMRNQRHFRWDTNPITIGTIKTFYPKNPGMYFLGVDPYRTTQNGNISKLSLGSGMIFQNRDNLVDPEETSIYDTESYCFQALYLARPEKMDEFYEDMLKAAIFWGAKLFPERNIGDFTTFVYTRGYAGYFHYQIDARTGVKSKEPGLYTNEQSKEKIFKENREYIKQKGHKEVFIDYLEQCLAVKKFKDMGDNDAFAAGGLALVAAHSDYTEEIEKARNESIVLTSSWFMPHSY